MPLPGLLLASQRIWRTWWSFPTNTKALVSPKIASSQVSFHCNSFIRNHKLYTELVLPQRLFYSGSRKHNLGNGGQTACNNIQMSSSKRQVPMSEIPLIYIYSVLCRLHHIYFLFQFYFSCA